MSRVAADSRRARQPSEWSRSHAAANSIVQNRISYDNDRVQRYHGIWFSQRMLRKSMNLADPNFIYHRENWWI